MVYLGGAAGAVATKLGEARSWSIKIDVAAAEDTAMGDSWETTLKGLMKWSGSSEGNFDTAEATGFDAAGSTTTRPLFIYPVAATTARYYYGTCWPSLSVEGGISGAARYTLDFTGNGALTSV